MLCSQSWPNTSRITEQAWPEESAPLVSIICITYNQVDFIRSAIESFLIQETTFKVEIIVHDDASTDGTAEVVREYESIYPHLIRSIYQTENQFSKRSTLIFPFRKARGQMIALCEGDDYWIDPSKLIKQVNFMVSTGVGICGHPAYIQDASKGLIQGLAGYTVSKPSVFDSSVLIAHGGNMMPLGSILLASKVKDDILAHMPPVRFHTGVQLLGARRGGLAVLPEPMMTYRTNVPNSATVILFCNLEELAKTTRERILSFRRLKDLYGDTHEKGFRKLIARQVNLIDYRTNLYQAYDVLKCMTEGEVMSYKIRVFIDVLLHNFYVLSRSVGIKFMIWAGLSKQNR